MPLKILRGLCDQVRLSENVMIEDAGFSRAALNHSAGCSMS
jgi:hypothetical protein